MLRLTSLGILLVASATAMAQAPSAPTCKIVGRTLSLPAVPEASGLAWAGGAFWTLNDSHAPVLHRIDISSGRTTTVSVHGAAVRDWEDLAAGVCPTGTCLYVADIGDNRSSRERITIYQLPVPAPGEASVKPVAVTHLRYPDHPHDAEALLLTKAGTFIITKEIPPRVYRVVQSSAGDPALSLVRSLNEKARITGAAASPDGRWVALRSNRELFVYAAGGFVKGGNPVRVDLQPFNEPQGEGVAFGAGGEMVLVSEGGGDGVAGTLTRLHCAFIR